MEIDLAWTNPSGAVTATTVYEYQPDCSTPIRTHSLGVLDSYSVTGLSPSTTYCFTVTASTNGGASAPSVPASATTYAPFASPTISVAPTPFDSGQSSTLTTISSLTGGALPFSCQWLVEAPGDVSYTGLGASVACSVGDPPTASTGVLAAAGVWSFELQVTDSSGLRQTMTSNSVPVTVDAALAVSTPTATPNPAIITLQTAISTTVSGGSGPGTYTYVWSGLASGCTSSNSPTILCSPTSSGPFAITVTVKDGNGNSVTSAPRVLGVSPVFSVAFTQTGFPPGTSWAVTFNGTTSGSVAVRGTPAGSAVAWAQVAYIISFRESGLAGEEWGIEFNGTLETAVAPASIAFSGPNGTFSYRVSGLAGWHQYSLPYSGTVTVAGAGVVVPTLVLAPYQAFTITFEENGLPSGGNGSGIWSVNITGLSLTAPVGLPIITPLLANGTYAYTVNPYGNWYPAPGTGSGLERSLRRTRRSRWCSA